MAKDYVKQGHFPVVMSGIAAQVFAPEPDQEAVSPPHSSCPCHHPDLMIRLPAHPRLHPYRPSASYNHHGDIILACASAPKEPRPCSWAWSQQIGLFVPAGLDRRNVCYPTMYALKRYNPSGWRSLYAPFLNLPTR